MLGVCAQVAADKAEIYDTVVFSTPPRVTEQQLWPKHCVQETWGAELHPQLKVRARVWLSRVVFGCHVLCLAVTCRVWLARTVSGCHVPCLAVTCCAWLLHLLAVAVMFLYFRLVP